MEWSGVDVDIDVDVEHTVEHSRDLTSMLVRPVRHRSKLKMPSSHS